MSTPHLIPAGRMLHTADWLFDTDLEAQDNAAMAEMDRREEIANAVTFADLLEEMADFTGPRAEVFMQAYRRGTADEKHTMWLLIDQAMDRIVEQRLTEPAAKPRFPMTSCSQCGKELGPGDHGVSHCEHHGASA